MDDNSAKLMTTESLDSNQRERLLSNLESLRKQKGFTYEAMADKLNVNKVWLASAFKGQQWVPEEYALKIADILGATERQVSVLMEHPHKGKIDPILYRLYEVIDTYGPAIKDLIHEKAGNGIMSAVDFSLDVDIEKGHGGDRIKITWNGKLLPYSQQGKYPW